MKIIFDYNRTIFDPEKQELYSGVLELIAGLSAEHELFLVSKNEQGRKDILDSLGIGKFFRKIIFTDNKSEEVFREIGGETENVMVVGDRVRGEIEIGNKLDYITIWVQQGKFSNEEPLTPSQVPSYTITDILQLRQIIKKHE